MSIYGNDTSDLDSYNDGVCFEDKMVSLRDKVNIIPNDKLTDTQSVISINDGSQVIKNTHDLSNKIEKNILENKIINKSVSLLSKSKSELISNMLSKPKSNNVSSLVDCLVS